MKDSLKKWLDIHEINYILHQHPAVFTVPEAIKHCGHIKGTHCKNLFLKNKKSGQFYLVTIPYDKRLDLNKFRRMVKAPKIRFAEAEDLLNILGITPGAVSPIGLVNDLENKTIFMIDIEVWNADEVCCHPNDNSETMQIPGPQFQRLIKATGNPIEIRKLPYSAPIEE